MESAPSCDFVASTIFGSRSLKISVTLSVVFGIDTGQCLFSVGHVTFLFTLNFYFHCDSFKKVLLL